MRLPTHTEVNFMKTNILIAVAAASLMTLTACGTNPTNAQIGTGVGAVAGGLAGSALGGTGATILGAGAGALVGNEVGKRTQK
jgi:osmotically inducible lipoprotein OsmB